MGVLFGYLQGGFGFWGAGPGFNQQCRIHELPADIKKLAASQRRNPNPNPINPQNPQNPPNASKKLIPLPLLKGHRRGRGEGLEQLFDTGLAEALGWDLNCRV